MQVKNLTTMTWKDEITADQIEKVKEFKRRVNHLLTPKMLEDESLCYRFLKARDFDFDRAENMLRKHISWRKELQVDTILDDYKIPESIEKYCSNSVIGVAKDGCIVRYIDIGNADLKGLLNSAKKVDFLLYNTHCLESDVESLRKHNEKYGTHLTKMMYIYNYEHMTFAKATHKKTLEYMMWGAKVYQDNYPERIKQIFVINASIYFTMLYSVIKHVIDAAIIDKVRCFGSEGWKEALLETIDADELPMFLGGNKTDENGDPLCRSFIVHGGVMVPEKYLLKKSERRLSLAPGVKKVSIVPFAKSEIKFEVEEANSILEWEFETKANDIGFGVYYKSEYGKNVELEEVVSNQRIDTCYEPESGMYRCQNKGIYIIIFDNSYSWIRPKEIFYRARILKPTDQITES